MAKKKTLIILAVFVLLLLLLNGDIAAFFLMGNNKQPAPAQQAPPALTAEQQDQLLREEEERHYQARFTIGDASYLCSEEVRSRNSNLIQMYEDSLSSRFVEDEQTYIIMFNTVVGTSTHHEEKSHTCHISVQEKAVSYYREIITNRIVRPVQ